MSNMRTIIENQLTSLLAAMPGSTAIEFHRIPLGIDDEGPRFIQTLAVQSDTDENAAEIAEMLGVPLDSLRVHKINSTWKEYRSRGEARGVHEIRVTGPHTDPAEVAE